METLKQSNETAPRPGAVRSLVMTALLFALAVVLSVVESLIPVPIPAPGVRFGLSNIVVMYALFFLGGRRAAAIAVLKSLFVFVARGGLIAASLSLGGGLLSVASMLLLQKATREPSYFRLSVVGAITHNLGQLLVISALYKFVQSWVYLPILLISGIASGAVTAILLRLALPALQRLERGRTLDR